MEKSPLIYDITTTKGDTTRIYRPDVCFALYQPSDKTVLISTHMGPYTVLHVSDDAEGGGILSTLAKDLHAIIFPYSGTMMLMGYHFHNLTLSGKQVTWDACINPTLVERRCQHLCCKTTENALHYYVSILKQMEERGLV